MIGTTLSHYRITAKLGEGGMGKVYRATDTTLGREVALKVLPAEMAGDPARLARFEREAKTVAALNHPNIVTLYSVEEAGGVHFLTMELVEGQTLDRHVPAGGAGLARFFELAVPIADALADAHAQGITHRDLKPANVMVTEKGQVKVLDFGLAKLSETGSDDGDETLTQDGLILGTVQYMSPEQTMGRPADHRSDVFSLGVLLYEMATGRRPFQGASAAELMSSILRDEPPPVTGVKTGLPNHLGRVVRRCLEKEPSKRYQNALEIRNELEVLESESSPSPAAPPATRPVAALSASGGLKRWWLPAAAAFGVALGWWTLRDRPDFAPGETAVAAEATAERRSLVVLPFDNLGASEDAYFADGMTDEIISRLAAVEDLDLISRTTAFQYDRQGKSIPAIGRELRVDYVVTGTVRWAREGPDSPSRVRITPRLVRAKEDRQVWSRSFERRLTDVFAIQNEIASSVADSLDLSLVHESGAPLSGSTPDAYQAYLKGLSYHNRTGGHLHDLRQAALLAENATELAPEFAAAWALLAEVHVEFMVWGKDPSRERLARARQALARAEALAPDAAESARARASVHYGAEEYEAAHAAILRLSRLQPANGDAVAFLAALYRRQGRFEESVELLERAMATDPMGTAVSLATSCIMVRRHACADRASTRGIELMPDRMINYALNAYNLVAWKGDPAAAAPLVARLGDADGFWAVFTRYFVAAMRRDGAGVLAAVDSSSLDTLEHFRLYWPMSFPRASGYRLLGEKENEREALEAARGALEPELERRPEDARVWSALGIVLARLGRADEAIVAGERAVEIFPLERDPFTAEVFLQDLAETYALSGRPEDAVELIERVLSIPAMLTIPFLRVDPRWDPLRGHPGFERLLASEPKTAG